MKKNNTKKDAIEEKVDELIIDIFNYYHSEDENLKTKIQYNYEQLNAYGKTLINQYFFENNFPLYPVFASDKIYWQDEVDTIFNDVYQVRLSIDDSDCIYLGDEMYCHITKGIVFEDEL